MNPFMAEIIGTMILVLLGNGVVAGVVLQKSKSHQGGWIVITAGWGLAVAVAVYMVGAISGAHLNPAVTIAMATISQGDFSWGQVPGYILAQMIGAVMGSVLVWMTYLPHWKETPDQDAKRATFCTAPAIRNTISNLICEIIGTFVLVLGVLTILRPDNLVAGSGFDSGPAFGWITGVFDRAFARRSDRLCHQPGQGPGAKNCPRHPSHSRER